MFPKNKIIELLSPAKTAEYGKYAINFGADAVYIGGPSNSARAAAANSIYDIENLCSYAHKLHAKVYVAINTILFENELDNIQNLIHQVYNAGADAIIIQDFGIAQMNLPPIPIHISTQAHNVDLEKIKFYEDVGFSRVVLARELSLNKIQEINSNTNIETEVFVHGAICVSYSGQCYMSAYIGNRSANRGECAQSCRLPWNVFDNKNNLIFKNANVLSPKDMNRVSYIKNLIDIGVNSFKIEGRLKDINYLKNITAFYRNAIDKVLENSHEFSKSSIGKLIYNFTPDPDNTFNREYTDYFIDGKKENINSLSTKPLGKFLGKVIQTNNDFLVLDTSFEIINGDGLCYINENNELSGFYVNKIEKNRIFHNEGIIKTGTSFFRNYNHNFIKKLNDIENCRFIEIDLNFDETEKGFVLNASTTDSIYNSKSEIIIEKNIAKSPESAIENIRKQLNKDGGTSFVIREININTKLPYFLPISLLNSLRRDVLNKLDIEIGSKYLKSIKKLNDLSADYYLENLDYSANISNSYAEKFFSKHNVKEIDKAFELNQDKSGKTLMTTEMCIRLNLGKCPKYNNYKLDDYPKNIEFNNNKFEIIYRCDECKMEIKSI